MRAAPFRIDLLPTSLPRQRREVDDLVEAFARISAHAQALRAQPPRGAVTRR
jgi:hypothetical protein